MKLPVADSHDRITLPPPDGWDPDPTERMTRLDFAEAIASCKRASDRAMLVAARAGRRS